MPSTEVSAYPWSSDAVFAAELDATGAVIQANAALTNAGGGLLVGSLIQDLLSSEQRLAFDQRLRDLGPTWERASFSFLDLDGGAAEDRSVWLRRRDEGTVDLVAEPAWSEHGRLVEQVLQLNDDLIASQRAVARRQRDLEHAQERAAQAAVRVSQLEAILLAGLIPQDFDEALHSLLRNAQELLPGDRADIFLLDESGERLVVRASAGKGQPPGARRLAIGEGVVGGIAANGVSRRVDDLTTVSQAPGAGLTGSMIGTPLRAEGQVIGVLSVRGAGIGCFTEQHLWLLELVGERVALAIAQAQLRDREQRLVETLQRTLLPQSLPELPGVEIAALYRPRGTSVGGDFYDAFTLPAGRLGVVIGDVTGKGLRAAAAMSRLRNALHAYALDSESPAEVLMRLGRLAEADAAMATALYLVLDPATGLVDLATAGHLPPLRLTGPGASYVDVAPALSPPLGLSVDERPQMSFDLPRGSTLVLYTDGLVERTRNIDDGFEVLAASAGDRPAESLRALCEYLIEALTPTGRYRDDVALVALRRGG